MPRFTVYLLKTEYNFLDRYSVLNGIVTENNFSVFNDGITTENNTYIDAYITNNKIEKKLIKKSNSINDIYFRNTDSKKPWWKDFWEMPEDLENKSTDIICLLEITNRKVVITHGHGRFIINPLAIEYDFGLRTALNVIDEEKIKSADLFTPSEVALRTRKQTGIDSKLEEYDINIYNTLLKNISGKVKDEYSKFFSNIDGADNIHFSFKGKKDELIKIISNLLDLYKSDIYKNNGFAWVDNFRIIKDKVLIRELDKVLISNLNDMNEDIILTFPEILDKAIPVYYRYHGIDTIEQSSRFPELDIISQIYNNIRINNLTIDENNIYKIQIISVDFSINKDCFAQKLYQCLYFDLVYKNNHYFIENGCWYKVDDAFLGSVDKEYREIQKKSRSIIFQYNKLDISNEAKNRKKHKEYIFNEKLVKYLNKTCVAELLDTKLIKQIEVCDVLYKDSNEIILLHNKYKYGSSALSHLFSQGYVSAQSLTDPQFRKLANTIISNSILQFPDNDLFLRKSYVIMYGIISRKNAKNEFNLPLFSKINLCMFNKNMGTLDYKLEIVFFEEI